MKKAKFKQDSLNVRQIRNPQSEIPNRKAELRKIYLARQKSLLAEERFDKSKRIAEHLFENFDFKGVRFLHCFIAIEKFNEIDTALIFERIWKDYSQIETIVPRVNFQTGEIENLKFTSRMELVKNLWQIHEPTHNELIEADKIDVVLVPLLCFDTLGFRVGYGKGFYDKLLKNCRRDCRKIGLSYFSPVERIADAQKFDVKLDYCITPEEIFNLGHEEK